MAPDPRKVTVVKEWPVPTSKDVKSFVGLASYYRRYIPQFASIAAPLHHLMQKDTPFCWTDDCQIAFDRFKEHLTEAPVLVYPQFHSSAPSFHLYTDASSVGIGAVLE